MTDDKFDAGYLVPGRPSPLLRGEFTARPDYNAAERAKVDLAEATRRIMDEQVTTVADTAAIREAEQLVKRAADLLAGREHGRVYDAPAEGSLQDATAKVRPFPNYSPFIGSMNPIAPPLVIEWGEDFVIGRATYGLAYEGPPGCLHGGFIAAGFDEILGLAQGLSGQVGMTGRLTVSYRSPTPLFREVAFTGRFIRVEGRKTFTHATLHAGDTLCAEAEGLFISMKPEVFERLAALRGEKVPPR
jgi:acyl-coenzyme A thioesterase PaaI-like protein